MKVNDVTFTIPHQAGSALDIQAVENGYEIHAAKKSRIDIFSPGRNPATGSVIYSVSDRNLNPTKDISIKIGTVSNKLTGVNHDYYNGNTTFTYVLGIEEGKTSLPGTFKRGDCRITDIHAYAADGSILSSKHSQQSAVSSWIKI